MLTRLGAMCRYALVQEFIVHEAFPATFNQQLKFARPRFPAWTIDCSRRPLLVLPLIGTNLIRAE